MLALGAELSADPGVALLRELVGAGRDGRVASSLPFTIELLLVTLGRAGLEELLAPLRGRHDARAVGLGRGHAVRGLGPRGAGRPSRSCWPHWPSTWPASS